MSSLPACLQGSAFDFDPQSVQFNAFFGCSGAVSFAGTWTGDQRRYTRLTSFLADGLNCVILLCLLIMTADPLETCLAIAEQSSPSSPNIAEQPGLLVQAC